MIERGLSSMKKNFGRSAVCSSVLIGTLWLGMGPSAASEIRVFTSGAPSAVQKVMAAKFTDTTGHRVVSTAATLQEIRSQLSGTRSPEVSRILQKATPKSASSTSAKFAGDGGHARGAAAAR